jgi:hypothetical protein
LQGFLEADARTRTGDPFITRERQVRDARPRAGTCGHLIAGNWPVLPLLRWTRIPARARADVPVLYPTPYLRAPEPALTFLSRVMVAIAGLLRADEAQHCHAPWHESGSPGQRPPAPDR